MSTENILLVDDEKQKNAPEKRTPHRENAGIRDEFMSKVSHELRTPLTSIYASLRLITEGVAGELPEQAKRLSDIAYNNSERLVALINLRLEQLAGLLEVSGTVAVTLETDSMLGLLVDLALEQANCAAGSLALLDEETGDLETVAVSGRPPLAVPQIKSDAHFLDGGVLSRDADSVAIAIKTPKKLLGVLCVAGKNDGEVFTDNDVEFLSILVSHTAIAIENARLFKKLNGINARLRESQEKLERWNKELETEVAKRTKALRKANTELTEANENLKKLDKEKTKFLNTVAHDLKTPLTSIRAYADMILMYKDEAPEVYEKFLNIIVYESDRLGNLINNLLNLARIESGAMKYEAKPLNLRRLIDHFISVYSGQTASLGIALASKIPESLPEALGDKDGLSQVITNLLSNAVKFTPSGGKIQVEAITQESESSAHINSDEICVCVSDTGRGIPKKYHDKIFERFGRVGTDAETCKEGLGLGLAIAKQIVERNGGKIWVESDEGKGSRFLFTIPLPKVVRAQGESHV